MRIATLTLHLPFNYGNALQMFSLHHYLREQGVDTEILSHWFFENRKEILYYHNILGHSLRQWLKFLFQCLLLNGQWIQYRREAKIKCWLETKICWSKAQGAHSRFPTEDLKYDAIIVGSDQVWNPVYKSSDFFLLGDFPDRIRKIAYAASLGGNVFPPERREFFSRHLLNFAAISVRESSAVEILHGMNIPATLVCDPTLLHTREEWCKLLGIPSNIKPKNELMMYFVTPDYRTMWKDACRVARESHQRVHVYAFVWSHFTDCRWRPFRNAAKTFIRNAYIRLRLFLSGVRLHFSADPTEFVRRIASTEGLITDSFHGVMFATIFGKKCNVVIGTHPERQQMSARLRDFLRDLSDPEIVTERPAATAMRQLSITPKLSSFIERSKKWLADALGSI